MTMRPQLWGLSALAVELGLNVRTVAAALRGTKPDGRAGRNDGWLMATALRALEARAGPGGSRANGRSRSPGGARHPLIAGAIHRTESWSEVHAEPAPVMTIAEFARMLGERRETVLTWLRAGAPYAAEGDWRSGAGFTLRLAAVIEWVSALAVICDASGDGDAKQRLKLLDGV